MLKFKPEVRIKNWTESIQTIMRVAATWATATGIAVEVNSIDDGTHGPTTLHGISEAADLDTDGDKPEDLEALYQWMRRKMPAGFDVIHEKDHVHVEWDVKRAESRL